ncbi:Unannotated [Lentimonas sp. CC19]|nr:Unannotated [Lentimonas sp. CC10]CAA6691992.1 Unannotated [Lentimonas sp. CC19]CAA7070539.1 Unannotated [Lentimonas sp. CC11]
MLTGLVCTLAVVCAPSISMARNFDADELAIEFAEIRPTGADVTVTPGADATAAGVVLDFEAGKSGYPGVYLMPNEGETWDLSDFTCIEFRVINQGEKPLYLTSRIDNKGDHTKKPWNSDSRRIKPGEAGVIRTFFGYSYRKAAFKLDASKVSKLMLFTSKATENQSIKIESIKATKFKVPFKSDFAPVNGELFGGASSFDVGQQLVTQNGAMIEGGADAQPLKVEFSKADQSVQFRAWNARWDLRKGHQLVVTLKNVGRSAVSPSAQAVSVGKKTTDRVTVTEPIQAGQRAEIIVPFMPAIPKLAGDKNKFESNKVEYVALYASDSDQSQVLEIESVVLASPAITLPEWVGQRPPIEGDWVQTFSEEFDGDAIDLTKWNIYGPNFWDKISHFSRDNVAVEDGNAVLTFEKRFGHHNDDPKSTRSNEYATGFLSTYGKWVQRYGYFEARMKLPEAPGLWPAFWLMPDRGLDAGEQWQRQSINEDAMEFDIMEYLSGWGTNRFTVAFHYDGYGKDHKATGAGVYTAQDEEGYITTGLLWLPGLAVVYNNGVEIVRWETDRISTVESNIIFTFVGGGWDNLPIEDGELPEDFEIDYVRCWQLKELASDVDGVQSTQNTLAAPTTPDAR